MISACVMQINEWLLERRAASPEELPAFPSTADGGSRAILQQATAAAAAAAEPPAAVKGSARPSGKPIQASTASARKSKDTGDPSLYSSPMHEGKVASTDFCPMARSTWTNVQHCFRAEKDSVCFEPATLRRQCFFNLYDKAVFYRKTGGDGGRHAQAGLPRPGGSNCEMAASLGGPRGGRCRPWHCAPLLMPGAHAHYAAVHPDSNQARRHKGCTWSPHAWPDKSHAIHDVPQQGGGLKPRAEVWGMHVQRMAPGKQCSWTESFSRRRCAPA